MGNGTLKGTIVKGSSGSAQAQQQVALLSITTAPGGSFAAGSKYYNETDKKIYTAVVADTWVDATSQDPSFSTIYTFDSGYYIWDGDSLESTDLTRYALKTEVAQKANLVGGKVPLEELPELGGGTAATTSFEPTATITSTNVQDAVEEVDAKAIGADAAAEAVAGDLADTEINGVAIAGKNNSCEDLGLQCEIKEGNNITKTQISESAVKVLLNFDDSVTDSAASPLTYTQPAGAEYSDSLFSNSPTKKSIKFKNYSGANSYGNGYGPYATTSTDKANFGTGPFSIGFVRKANYSIIDNAMRAFGSREDDNNYCNLLYGGQLELLISGSFTTFPNTPITQTIDAREDILISRDTSGTIRAFKNGVIVAEQANFNYPVNFNYPNSPYCCIAYSGNNAIPADGNILMSGVFLSSTPTVEAYTPTNIYPTSTSITKDVVACKNYFGEIYTADNSTAQTIPTGATYTKSTAFNTAGEYRGTTLDVANNKIVLPSAGYYRIGVTGSSKLGSAGITLKTALFLNGVKVPNCQAIRKVNNANDESTVSFGGIVKVDTANSEIDVRVAHDQGEDVSLTTVFCNLNALYIGDLTL